MSEQERLEIMIDPTGAQSGGRAVRQEIDRISSSWVVAAATAFAAEQTFLKVWQAGKRGAEFEESLDRLNRQASAFHSNAALMMTDLQSVSNGQLNMANSVQLASRALAQGLDPDQIRTFTQAADLLGDVMGTDLKTAFDQILQGLATGRTQMLANIGVHLDLEKEVKNLAVSTNRTTEQITKQERAAIGASAILKQLGGTLDKFSSDAVSDADKMAAIEARFDDMTLAVQRFSKSLVIDAVDGWKKFSDFVNSPKNNPFRAADQAIRESTPGNINHPVTQEIMGRAIVSDTQGNLARKAEEEAKRKHEAAITPMDPTLGAIQVDGAAGRMRAEIETVRDRTISGIQHQSRLFGLDQQMGQQGVGAGVGAEAFLKAQHEAKLRELSLAGEAQNKLLQLETETYHKRTALGFESTQEKIQAEEAFKTKVTSINSEVAKIVQEFGNTSREQETERAVFRGRLQEDLGRQITDGLISNFKVEEDLRHKSQNDAITYYTNLAKFQEAYGTSRENQLTTQYDLVRATLAKELDATYETAEKVLNAWRNGDSIHAVELLEGTQKTWDQVTSIMMDALAKQGAVSEKYSDDFFGGFAKSMHRYIQDDSMFGLGADQARSVAQAMQQSFKTFFFDAMEGHIKGFKDVLKGLTDFAKNIVSDVASKLMSRSLLSGLDSLPSLFGGGGNIPAGGFNAASLLGMPGFARGGITTGLSIVGEAGPEAVVPLPDGRSIPIHWKGGYGMPSGMMSTVSVPVKVEIYNQNSAQTNVQTQSQQGSDGSQTIKVFIKQAVKEGFANGDFNNEMATYGARLQPVRR